MSKFIKKFAVIATTISLLAGCSAGKSSSTAETTTEKKVLRFGQANAGTGLDMQISTSSGAASIADEVTESLLRFDDNNEEEPVLIEDFPKVSEDGKVYSFTLKKGVYFTDGTELHSSDVKYTFERMFTPATGAKSTTYFSMIAGAKDMLAGNATELSGFEIVDDYHFNITLDYAFAPFVKNLGTSYANIFPEKATKEAGAAWGTGTNLIGTGPYKIQSNDDTTEVVLVKNEKYHGGDVNLDELHFLYYDDAQTKLIAYENGDIDLADLPASLLEQYQSSHGDEIHTYHPLGTSFISLNLKSEYISDVNVRKAISLAINREELVKTILAGAGIPATSFLNNQIPGHDDSKKVLEYNPEAAKKLLAEAGYSNGISLTAEIREADKAVFDALQGYLAEVGIQLTLNIVDNATWNSDRAAGNLALTGMTWNALYPDGDFQMYNYFYSKNSVNRGVFYDNPAYDAALDKGRASTDEKERAELYKEADKILTFDDYACIPLYYPQSQFIAKSYVKNFTVGNLIYHFWNADIDAQAAAKEQK
ncbi:MAG: ABC transporter substrate-binding protein [Solobacterium sp.]|nr:ABC transporter substrate-binding protein [Solobacterium sp.]